MIADVSTRVWSTLVCAGVGASLAMAGCNRGPAAMTEEQFCAEYARIECSKVAAFCSFNPASCEPVRTSACRASAGRVKGAGHEFNPDNSDRCLKKLEEAYKALPISAAMLKAVDDACTRVIEGTASGQLDPRIPPSQRADPRMDHAQDAGRSVYRADNLIINACRPYAWKDEFPKVNVNSRELRQSTEQKWKHLFAGV